MLLRLPVVALCLLISAIAQPIVSTRAGTVYSLKGSVLLDNRPVKWPTARFPVVGAGSELRSEEGHATVQLNPDTSLEIGPHSAVRMLRTALADTRVELTEGVIRLRCGGLYRRRPITLLAGGAQVSIRAKGSYFFDLREAIFRVGRGRARVTLGPRTVEFEGPREVSLDVPADASAAEDCYTRRLASHTARRWPCPRSSR